MREPVVPTDDNHDDEEDAADTLQMALEAIHDRGSALPEEEGVDDATPLPSPITREELLSGQKTDSLCQNIVRANLHTTGSFFFEDHDGLLCRRNPRNPDQVQIVLPDVLRARVCRLAH